MRVRVLVRPHPRMVTRAVTSTALSCFPFPFCGVSSFYPKMCASLCLGGLVLKVRGVSKRPERSLFDLRGYGQGPESRHREGAPPMTALARFSLWPHASLFCVYLYSPRQTDQAKAATNYSQCSTSASPLSPPSFAFHPPAPPQ